jgi:hypothetical protein
MFRLSLIQDEGAGVVVAHNLSAVVNAVGAGILGTGDFDLHIGTLRQRPPSHSEARKTIVSSDDVTKVVDAKCKDTVVICQRRLDVGVNSVDQKKCVDDGDSRIADDLT